MPCSCAMSRRYFALCLTVMPKAVAMHMSLLFCYVLFCTRAVVAVLPANLRVALYFAAVFRTKPVDLVIVIFASRLRF